MSILDRTHSLLSDFFELEKEAYIPETQNSEESYQLHFFNDFARLHGYLPPLSSVMNLELEPVDFNGRTDDVMFNIAHCFKVFAGGFYQWSAAQEIQVLQNDGYLNLSAELKIELHEKISEAREVVLRSEWLEERHRSRILTALSGVDIEIDKELSDYHKVLGMVEDAAESVGNSSKKAEPIIGLLTGIRNAITGERNKPLQINQDARPRQITDQSKEE